MTSSKVRYVTGVRRLGPLLGNVFTYRVAMASLRGRVKKHPRFFASL